MKNNKFTNETFPFEDDINFSDEEYDIEFDNGSMYITAKQTKRITSTSTINWGNWTNGDITF